MPNRIPTPGVPTPAVRASKTAQPAAKPAPTPSRPAVGSDIYARKKYGKSSWNNGYTN